MLKQWLGLGRKAAGRTLALGFGTGASWSPRGYAAFATEGYARNAVAHRCVRLIAEAVSATPLKTSGEDRVSQAALALITAPNPDQSGAELMDSVQSHLQVAGDAYLHLSGFEAGTPGLYALRPDRVRVMTGPKGWAEGWEYRTATGAQVFQRDRASGRSPVLHLKLFNPTDDQYGLSPMEAAARAVDVHASGGAWAKALLDNAARPSGALVMKTGSEGQGRLTPDQFDRLKAELESLYTGPDNAGRPLLLEGGLDWKPMGHSPAEMDFIQARREAAREIALAFGVPPMLLGLPGDNTYSNYREANQAFYRQTVLPLAKKTAAALNRFLAPWFGTDPKLCVDEDGLPAFTEERAARWAQISGADFLSPDEKRVLLGLAPQGDMS
ncbi:MAG: phage portal protein [Oceanicaulis sp.]|uniref:phage portal protein n=1 Tax=Oceanicaulis sp. UBA2681 TaxID=1947007 RepID=UPI000C0B61AC|nr:phage portal protein [Oceanicaulis sp. UBA2681]MAP48186.1 phage portal protein [Oceanicaulis sp.]